MADVWWLVSVPDDVEEGDDDDTPSLMLVEFRESWGEAKARFAELSAGGQHVDVFDADGELVRSQESESGCWGRMSAPRRAGWYSWTDATGHVLMDDAPAHGWRATVQRHNAKTKGLPG